MSQSTHQQRLAQILIRYHSGRIDLMRAMEEIEREFHPPRSECPCCCGTGIVHAPEAPGSDSATYPCPRCAP